MKPKSGIRYGTDHLPETRRVGAPGRPGGVPVRPDWQRERPTNVKAVDDLPDFHLRAALEARGLGATVVDGLMKDRRTAGGRWRITQELSL